MVKSFASIVKTFTKTITQLDTLITHNEVQIKDNQKTIDTLLNTNVKYRDEAFAAETLKNNLNNLLGNVTE